MTWTETGLDVGIYPEENQRVFTSRGGGTSEMPQRQDQNYMN